MKIEEGIVAIGNSAIEGNVTITDTMYLGNTNFEFNTNAIGIISPGALTVDSYPVADYKFAKYFLTVKTPANTHFHAMELTVVAHGANAFLSVYGEVWNDHPLGEVDASVVSGNVRITFNPVANVIPVSVSSYRSIQA